jgi:hypothetical protein
VTRTPRRRWGTGAVTPEFRSIPRWFGIPPFEAWVALIAIYTGISRLLPFVPTSGAAAVAVQFPVLSLVWSVLYALGGVLVLTGLWRSSPRWEGAGLHLLGSGITVGGLAALSVGAALLPVIITQGGAIGACLARLYVLRRMP